MKKLRVLLSMAIVCGVALVASAQPIPFLVDEAGDNYFAERAKKKAIEAQNADAQFIEKIQREGSIGRLSYTFILYSSVDNLKDASKKNERKYEVHSAWRLADEEKGIVYILLNRSDWEEMYTSCMPSQDERVVYNNFGYRSQQTIEIRQKGPGSVRYTITSAKGKIALLNHKHYKVKGQEYTVIKLKKSK